MAGFVAVQNLWNLAKLNPDGFADQTIAMMDEALWDYHRETQLAAVPYTSQANGLFQKLETTNPEALPPNLQAWYINPVTLERFRKIQKLSTESGLSSTQIVLGYLTSQPFPTFPIVGPKSSMQLADCLSAVDVLLSPEQIKGLLF
jgi:aryl-alcohol dehydrogenase-like predicted oxidoreductase